MIKDKHRDLINAAIDGELDDAGRTELDILLKESDEARKLHKDLQAIGQMLDEIPDVAPPPGLRQSLLNQISLPTSPAKAHGGAGASFALFPFASRYALARYAVAFIAGIMVTAIGYEYAANGVPGNEVADLVGTMVSSHDVPETTAKNTEILELDALTGAVTLHRSNGLYILEFDLDSSGEVELTMDLAGKNLVFDGFAQLDSDLQSVQVVHGVLRVTHEGQSRFAVLLRPAAEAAEEAPGNVAISFYAGGRQVHESVLETPR
jgi:hypothetical protein